MEIITETWVFFKGTIQQYWKTVSSDETLCRLSSCFQNCIREIFVNGLLFGNVLINWFLVT